MLARTGFLVTQLTPYGTRVRLYEGEPPVPYEILAPIRLRVGPAMRDGGGARSEAERRLRERVADLGGNAAVRIRWQTGWRASPFQALAWWLAAPIRLFLRDGSHDLQAHAVDAVAVRLLPVKLSAPRPFVAGKGAHPRPLPRRETLVEPSRVDLFRGEPPHPYRILGIVDARAGPSRREREPSLAEGERKLRERAAGMGATAVIHVEARFGFRARPWATLRHGAFHALRRLAGERELPDFAVRLEGVAVELYPIVSKNRPTTSSARSGP